MTSRRLHEVVHISKTGTVTIEPDATIEDLRKVIMSMSRLPALLAVAEAAEKALPYVDARGLTGDIYTKPISECYVRDHLADALAKLREIKP